MLTVFPKPGLKVKQQAFLVQVRPSYRIVPSHRALSRHESELRPLDNAIVREGKRRLNCLATSCWA